MKYSALSTLAMGLGGASAAALHPRSTSGTCCFGITVNGGAQSGSLGQLSDGQNRVGPGFGGSSFCITGTSITDSSGRGCVVALPQTQFQCDAGATPTSGFTITSGGLIEYNGSTVFYECAVNDNSQYNIYTTPGGTQCSKVTLSTTNSKCAAPAPYANTTTIVTSLAGPTVYSTGVSYTTLVSTASGSTVTVVSTAPASTVTVVSSAAPSTVTLPATTIYETAGESTTTLPATTVYETAGASTITLPATTAYETAPAATVTLPGTTVYETAPASSCATETQTVTALSTVTAAGAVTTTTVYSTVTAAGAQTTETVTVTAVQTAYLTATAYATVTGAGQTIVETESSVETEVSTAIETAYVTATVTGAGKTVVETESSVETETASVTEIQTAYATATVTGAGETVVETESSVETETASVTEVETAYATVTGAGKTVVESETASVTEIETAYATATVTGAGKTVVESETASVTVVESATPTTATVVESASPTTATVVESTTATAIQSTTATSASATATSSSCPPNLSGNYQYPHLIVPVNSSAPTTAFGTQYFGQVSSTVSTLFNFDIPASYQGTTCSLIFLLPLKSQLETSDYTTSGSGGIEVLELSGPATSATTYDTVPSVEADLGTFAVAPGSSTVIATSACAAGETLTYELKATGSYALYWFEDYNPSPLGLYIREC